MDLKNLQQINLKNLNPKQVQDFVKSRPDIFINILLIVVTLYATIFIYNSAKDKKQNLSTQTITLQDKWKVVEKLKKSEKELKGLVESFPKPVGSDQFTGKLSEIASKNNVQTISFSQPQKSSDQNLELAVLSFNIASEEYPNILSFIKDIENMPYALRIQKVSMELVDSRKSRRGVQRSRIDEEDEVKKYIEVNMEIGLIEVKK